MPKHPLVVLPLKFSSNLGGWTRVPIATEIDIAIGVCIRGSTFLYICVVSTQF